LEVKTQVFFKGLGMIEFTTNIMIVGIPDDSNFFNTGPFFIIQLKVDMYLPAWDKEL
jgi:hypothetical protein